MKAVFLNPVAMVIAAIMSAFAVAVEIIETRITPVAISVQAAFARPPPSKDLNRFMAAVQRGASMTSYVIGIAVAALVVAIITPIAFGQFFAVDTGSWDAQTILIWGIIPLVVILAIVLFFLNKADDQA